MNPERWRRIEQLFEQAVELEPDQRAQWLQNECVGDTVLLNQVESLILSELESGSMINQVIRDASWLLDDQAQPTVGQRIGPYEVVREIGRGGIGSVFLAHRADDEYQKQVAIKVVRSGLATSEVLRRFRSERQILANLDHPNIARLLDGGTTETGAPYVVMDYVEGILVDEYSNRSALSIEDRLRLFRKICAAVHYAHQNLVVHRDIKPGNILVTAHGEPKLLDFGIAKLLKADESLLTVDETRAGIRPMTPEYASPEQVRGEAITTASDVYSLGVVLYELLAGRRPYTFNRLQAREIERAICEQEPDRPSTAVTRKQQAASTDGDNDAGTAEIAVETKGITNDKLRRRLRGDLDNIVMMAMRKEPTRRYASVEQFSEDLRRHLDGLPVLARPATFGYRTQKFVRRHSVGVAATITVMVLIAALVGFYTWRLAGERDRARLEAAKAARVSEFLSSVFEVSNPSQSKGETITAKELLERGATRIKKELADQPKVQSTMMNVMGTVYLSLGLCDQAEPLLEEALSTRRQLYGEKNAEVAESLLGIGRLHYGRGDYERAESFSRQALELNRALFGNENLEVARSMNLLATTLLARKDYPAAEPMFRQVIDLRRKLQGNQHADVLTNLSNLSVVLTEKGDIEGAESIMREIVELRRQLYGDRNPQLATDINNLAAALYSRGELAGAEQLFREALTLRQKVLGEEHPEVAEGLNNLAVVLRDKGEYDEAESLLRQAIALETRSRGAGHWYVAYYQSTLGLVQHARGDYDAAEATFRRATETYGKTFSEDNAYTAVPVLGLGLVLTDKGSPEKGEPHLRHSLDVFQKKLPSGHWQTAMAESALGYSLALLKRFDEAEPLLLRSCEILRAKRGEQSRASRDCVARIIALYESWRKPELATEYRARLSK